MDGKYCATSEWFQNSPDLPYLQARKTPLALPDYSSQTFHFQMLRLCHMISHLPWHLPEVKWMENIVPPQNGSKTPQTYPICKLERHPWPFLTIAHKLFTFRCCDHFQWILHLPISLPPRYKTLMFPHLSFVPWPTMNT
jgi:hypothetical protein